MDPVTIKIECECGTRYKFDVEPVDGKMPVEVFCPHCGIDGTSEANRLIEVELAARSGAPVSPKIDLPKPFKASPAKPVLQVTGKRPPQHTVTLPPQAKKPGIGNPCAKHPKEDTVNSCIYCKRPICLVCMSKFGYFCSTACRNQAEMRHMDIPVYEGQESLIRERNYQRVKRIIIGSVALTIAMIALWCWYSFYGSKPQIKFAVDMEKASRLEYCRFAGAGQVLVKTDRSLSLYDARGLKQLWSTSLAPYEDPDPTQDEMPTPGEIEAERIRQKNEYETTGKITWPKRDFKPGKFHEPTPEDEFLNRFPGRRIADSEEGRVHVCGEEIWIMYRDNLVVFDRNTGKEKKKVALHGRILQMIPGDSVIFVTSTGRRNEGQITRVAFRTGIVATDKFTLPEPRKWKFTGTRSARVRDDASALLGEMGGMMEAGLAAGTEQEKEIEVPIDPHEMQYVPAGVNVARLEVQLLKKNVLTRQVLNPEDIKPKEEPGANSPLKVSDAMAMAKQLQYETMKNRGGIIEREDLSTYKVTLHRHLEDGTEDWTGEVVGQPVFVPLKTVDALVSSKSIVVFDKENGKLWESTLAFPAGSVSVDFGEAGRGPCCEAGNNTFYLYDSQALSSFEQDTGKVRWRMPLPGVRSVRIDPDGMLYVTNLDGVSKVDPENGKVLWKLDKKEVSFFLSGRYVYLSRSQVSNADLIQHMWTGSEIPTHFRIFRVNSKTGEILWEYYKTKEPAAMDFQDNRILLLFPTEYRKDPKNPMGKPVITPGQLQILKYLTF